MLKVFAALLAATVVSFVLDFELLAGALVLALMVTVPLLLGRDRERQARQEQWAAPMADVPRIRRGPLWWCFAAAMAMLSLGIALNLKIALPVNALLAPSGAALTASWIKPLLTGGVVIGLIGQLISYVHQGVSRVVFWVAGAFLVSCLHAFALGMVLLGLNIHLDTSVPVHTTARVQRIEPAKSVKGTSTLFLENWITPGGPPLSAPLDLRVFRLDMDQRHASFYVRQGFFGWSYGAEYTIARARAAR